MELLLSDIPPYSKSKQTKSSKDIFEDYLKKCDLLRFASGYISSDAMIELKKIIEVNNKPKIEMLIGMHYFDLFTRAQYDAAIQLNTTLRDMNLGFVNLSNTVKFHGKMYSFVNSNQPVAGIVGSSNLSSMIGNSSVNFEADIFTQNPTFLKGFDLALSDIISKLGTTIDSFNIDKFNEYNNLLEDQYGVEKISREFQAQIEKSKTDLVFEIPIKTEPKSNLNAFFGKGRVNQRGFEMPRPWYEVEIIVSKAITSNEDYPKGTPFYVITDDGWKFRCKTSGDFYKNFRSEDDLKILGKWIKGRLEQHQALKIGTPVTDEVLEKYGSKSIKLIKSTIDNLWILEFKSNAPR